MNTAIGRAARQGWRQLGLLGAMALCALLVVQKLVGLQVMDHAALAQAASQTFDQTVPVRAPRGEIRDGTGVPLVTSLPVSTLHVDPTALNVKAPVAARLLAPILHQDVAALTRLLTYRGNKYVLVADGLDGDATDAIRALNLGPGIMLDSSPRAHFLDGTLAAPLLGFVNSQDRGVYGIEQAYNDYLRGRDGARLQLTNTSTRPLPESARPRPTVPGDDIVLTVNATIQQIVEKRLQEAIARSGARGGAAVVMDPKTGAILAMASLPDFDPNHYGHFDPSLYNNRAIQEYQPGSTFKVFSVATGLDTHSFTPDTTVDDPGFFQNPQGPEVIHNWTQGGWGLETPEIMLRHSANVGMVQFALMIKPATTFYDYLTNRFGFTHLTGINLPGEDRGQVRIPGRNPWQLVDLLTNSYGQSIDVTPLQLTTAMAALANGGKRMRPYVVQRIVSPDGRTIKETQPQVVAQAVSPATAATMTTILHRSGLSTSQREWDPQGSSEATCALTKGYPIAAKTGTSTVDVHAYALDTSAGTVASLLGYAPVDDPKFAMLVMVDHPRRQPGDQDTSSHIYGAITAAPAWHDIAEQIYRYMNIQSSKTDPAPDLAGKQDIAQDQGPQGWNCEFDKPNAP